MIDGDGIHDPRMTTAATMVNDADIHNPMLAMGADFPVLSASASVPAAALATQRHGHRIRCALCVVLADVGVIDHGGGSPAATGYDHDRTNSDKR
jgi:hypothetical protein